MDERADLLPCLNCEGDALSVEVINSGWLVICPDCKSKTRLFRVALDAVDAWNGGAWFRLALERLRSA